MPVDGGARDSEEIRDLLDRLLAGVVELLCEGYLLGIEPWAAAPLAATSACGGESVARVCDDELALQFGEHREHPEPRATFSRTRVDPLFDDVQADAALAQLGAEGHEVQHGAAEAVQACDLQRVAVAQQAQHIVELRTAGLGTAGVVDVDEG